MYVRVPITEADMTEQEPLRRVNILIQREKAQWVATAHGLTVSALIRMLLANAYRDEVRRNQPGGE